MRTFVFISLIAVLAGPSHHAVCNGQESGDVTARADAVPQELHKGLPPELSKWRRWTPKPGKGSPTRALFQKFEPTSGTVEFLVEVSLRRRHGAREKKPTVSIKVPLTDLVDADQRFIRAAFLPSRQTDPDPTQESGRNAGPSDAPNDESRRADVNETTTLVLRDHDEAHAVDASAKKKISAASIVAREKLRQMRTWTTRDGRTAKARLSSFNPDLETVDLEIAGREKPYRMQLRDLGQPDQDLLSVAFPASSPTSPSLSETAYGKRVMAVRQLERDVLFKQIDAEGMLRVAGELQRKKPRPRSEAQMIVPRYDGFTKTLVDTHRLELRRAIPIATIDDSADVTALRQKLEIEKRSMELDFEKQQAANWRLRHSKRSRGTKAKTNQQLQDVIARQKNDKRAYDESLSVITGQWNLLRGIESEGPGGANDTTGRDLHHSHTRFEFIIAPQRERGRVWAERQAKYALLESTEKRVIMRDDYRQQAETLRKEVDQLIDKAANLIEGAEPADDLRQLAQFLQEQIVRSTAKATIELTAPHGEPVSYAPGKGISVQRQKMMFTGRAGDMEFEATLSPSLTLEEIHAPQWALKYNDKYPFIHSADVLSLWVGQFHIAIKPKNDLARQASPGNRSDMLRWVDNTLKLDRLAAL